MGVFRVLKKRFCERRLPAQSSNVCPISGQTSASGMCPISGQGVPSARATQPAASQKEEVNDPEPDLAPEEVEELKGEEVPAKEEATTKVEPPVPQQREEQEFTPEPQGEEATEPAPAAPKSADAASIKERGNAFFKQKEFKEAVNAYTEALELQREDASIWLNRSIAHRQLQHWNASLDDATRAADLDSSNAKAHYGIALALRGLGRTKDAQKACKTGLEAQPDNKALLQLRAELRRSVVEAEKAETLAEAKTPATSRTEGQSPKKAVPKSEEEQEADTLANWNKQVAEAKSLFSNIQAKADKAKAEKEKAAKEAEEAAVQPGCPASGGGCPASGFQDLKAEVQKKAVQQAYEWQGKVPTEAERESLKAMMVDMFKSRYLELKEEIRKAEAKSKAKKSALQTDQYDKEQKLGLQIKGGHRPMDRPTDVQLPDDYSKWAGTLTVEDLATYGAENPDRRYMLSVWGHAFDVSDRPDKYGPGGPYSFLTGKDITWGLFTGCDTVEFCNKFYDLHKAKDMGKDKLAGICSWLAWYETEYGKPVARMQLYENESALPAPPLGEMDDACCVM